jgi:hypothetical protein
MINQICRQHCPGGQGMLSMRHLQLHRNPGGVLVALLFGVMLSSHAANQTLAPVAKMTSAEVAETILTEGVIVRITDLPGDVRVGDGVSAGGVRIGDGAGWQEGDALTQDLNANGHAIQLGEGWRLLTLGGWGALSGPAEISEENGEFRLSVYGNTLLEIVSELAAVQINSFRFTSPNFEITTAIGEVQPTIMYTTNLITGTWQNAPLAGIITNASTYVFRTSGTNYGSYAYFRATIPSGSGSVADFSAIIKQNGERVATQADLAVQMAGSYAVPWPGVFGGGAVLMQMPVPISLRYTGVRFGADSSSAVGIPIPVAATNFVSWWIFGPHSTNTPTAGFNMNFRFNAISPEGHIANQTVSSNFFANTHGFCAAGSNMPFRVIVPIPASVASGTVVQCALVAITNTQVTLPTNYLYYIGGTVE